MTASATGGPARRGRPSWATAGQDPDPARRRAAGAGDRAPRAAAGLRGLVTLWLWATVLFAKFAEAVAEGRGKAQADTLRRSRKETTARRLLPDGSTEVVPSAQLWARSVP